MHSVRDSVTLMSATNHKVSKQLLVMIALLGDFRGIFI